VEKALYKPNGGEKNQRLNDCNLFVGEVQQKSTRGEDMEYSPRSGHRKGQKKRRGGALIAQKKEVVN